METHLGNSWYSYGSNYSYGYWFIYIERNINKKKKASILDNNREIYVVLFLTDNLLTELRTDRSFDLENSFATYNSNLDINIYEIIHKHKISENIYKLSFSCPVPPQIILMIVKHLLALQPGCVCIRHVSSFFFFIDFYFKWRLFYNYGWPDCLYVSTFARDNYGR